MENVLLPVLGRVSEDRDADTRTQVVQLLLDQLKDSSPTWAPHIIAILSSVSHSPLRACPSLI